MKFKSKNCPHTSNGDGNWNSVFVVFDSAIKCEYTDTDTGIHNCVETRTKVDLKVNFG